MKIKQGKIIADLSLLVYYYLTSILAQAFYLAVYQFYSVGLWVFR
jgi:hypothetical protein